MAAQDFFAKLSEMARNSRQAMASKFQRDDQSMPAHNTDSKDGNHIKLKKIQEKVDTSRSTAQEIAKLSIFTPYPTKWLRFKQLFSNGMTSARSMEMSLASQSFVWTFIIGLFIRKLSIFEQSLKRFHRQNRLSMFSNRYDHVRRSYMFVFQSWFFINGSNAFKLGFITFSSILCSFGAAAVQDKLTFACMPIGLGLTGFIYRFRRGLRAAMVYGVFGALLGCLSSCAMLLYCLSWNRQTLDEWYKEYRRQWYLKRFYRDKTKRQSKEAVHEKTFYELVWSPGQVTDVLNDYKANERARLNALYNLNIQSILEPPVDKVTTKYDDR